MVQGGTIAFAAGIEAAGVGDARCIGGSPAAAKVFCHGAVRGHGVPGNASQQPPGRQVTFFVLIPGSRLIHTDWQSADEASDMRMIVWLRLLLPHALHGVML